MLNTMHSTTVAAECRRLLTNLTQRGFTRFMARLFPDARDFEVVFALNMGEAPKKSLFEKMATFADSRMFNDGQHLKFVDKKRSPKNGTVVYSLSANFENAAPHHQLRCFLAELRDFAEDCEAVDSYTASLRPI